MSMGQRKRTHKVSKGLRRHAKVPLSAVQKVLLGKGQLDTTEVSEGKSHRSFMESIQREVETRWLKEQADAQRAVRAEELAAGQRIGEVA